MPGLRQMRLSANSTLADAAFCMRVLPSSDREQYGGILHTQGGRCAVKGASSQNGRSPCGKTKDNEGERVEHLIDVTVVDKLLEQDVALFLAEGVGEEGHPVLCQRGRERRPVGY